MKTPTRSPRAAIIGVAALALLAPLTGVASSAPPATVQQRPGPSAGIGDPYFPRDGNRGYNVRHYGLNLQYRPASDRLAGTAVITARARARLTRFNLDLDGLRVRSVRVNGRTATWSRRRGELRVNPAGRAIRKGTRFRTVVRYAGVPQTITDPQLGDSGFIHTDDGALVIGQPHVAATWFPVNDHPIDKAAYTFRITVPNGLEAVANGVLQQRRVHDTTTTWVWKARAPMASYLATANVGEFRLRSYRENGIRFWDAIDPDLFAPVARPRTGQRFAIAGQGNSAYKRLVRTIAVPAEGAQLSFWVERDTERGFDFMLVEARPAGTNDWTTLRDQNGHTTRRTGFACADLVLLHPFLRHYLTVGERRCATLGSTGRWWAASGRSKGYEQWTVDLSRYAGRRVEVSISYLTDFLIENYGLFVDDIEVSTGRGSTSFEDDGTPMDGWTVEDPPKGSPNRPAEWEVGTVAQAPPPRGEVATASFARQGEILSFLARRFGPYPFTVAGGIVDDRPLPFALENQTRPVYGSLFFGNQRDADLVVVHELAHQWFGDSLAVRRWKHIWLNEGFATYAEWLWQEREGIITAQRQFRNLSSIPPRDPFWHLEIGDPGPDALFDFPIYMRGAMTLHRLRQRVGDDDFFQILRRWHRSRAGGNVATAGFIRLAERISGRNLDPLFDAWLFTASKPRSARPGAVARLGERSSPLPGLVVRHPARGR